MESNMITFTAEGKTFDVPVEDIKKWIAALRSGEYKQGRGVLQSSEGYCCLGVGCLIFTPKDKLKLGPDELLFGSYPSAQPYAPEWLSYINVHFLCTKGGNTLSLLNDKGKSFNEIADFLEKGYLNQ